MFTIYRDCYYYYYSLDFKINIILQHIENIKQWHPTYLNEYIHIIFDVLSNSL